MFRYVFRITMLSYIFHFALQGLVRYFVNLSLSLITCCRYLLVAHIGMYTADICAITELAARAARINKQSCT